eukprot:9467405-Pyramimonas_sp.AAC.1
MAARIRADWHANLRLSRINWEFKLFHQAHRARRKVAAGCQRKQLRTFALHVDEAPGIIKALGNMTNNRSGILIMSKE